MNKGFIKVYVYVKHKKVLRVINKIDKLRSKRDKLEDDIINAMIKYYGKVEYAEEMNKR